MPSVEEFDALKNRLDALESLLHRVTESHKEVLEQYLPKLGNDLAVFIEKMGKTNNEQAEQIVKLVQTFTGAFEAFDKRLTILEDGDLLD